jgi:DNA polymerase-1
MKRIAIFDATNLIFRSFFAVPPLSTSDGQATNAVVGSLKTFRTTIQELKPDYVILSWDSGGKNFRHTQDPTYKAQRPPINSDLKSQFSIVQDAFARLQIPQIIAPPNIEGDDLTGSIAVQAVKAGYEAIIVSSDKDFYQLCRPNLKIYSFTVKKKDNKGLVDEEYIYREFNCTPKQLIGIKSLTGEKSDNITGVDGIGPKTATSLITKHGSIKNLISYCIENPKDKISDKILANLDIIANAYTLAEIKTDIKIPDNMPVKSVDCIIINEIELKAFFEHYELQGFLNNFSQWANLFDYVTPVR